jgi:glycine cleavage system H protein
MQVPDDLLYTEEHEWIRQVGDSLVRIGITDYAQDQLGDIVYVELPEVPKVVAKDDVFLEVESTKSVGEVYAPFAGTITDINEAVTENPELVNQSPYEEGWLVLMSVEGEIPVDALLDAAAYKELIE